jgi:hypothetical protein
VAAGSAAQATGAEEVAVAGSVAEAAGWEAAAAEVGSAAEGSAAEAAAASTCQ